MYDFAPLVAIGLALGGWIAGLQRARATQAPRAMAQASEASGPKRTPPDLPEHGRRRRSGGVG